MTLLCFFGTLVFPYSMLYFSHQFSNCCLFLCFYFLRRLREYSVSQQIALDFLIAFSGLVEYPLIPILLVMYAYFVFKTWRRLKLVSLLPGIATAFLFGFYNYKAFGAPWSLGYNHLADKNFLSGMSKGLYGISLPSWESLWGITFAQYRGIFFVNPILLFSLVGIYFGFKRKEHAYISAMVSAIALYFLFLNSSYFLWSGGACIGPRHMVPALLIFCIPLLFLPTQVYSHFLFILPATFSVALMFITSSVFILPNEGMKTPINQALQNFYFQRLSVGDFDTFMDLSRLIPARGKWFAFNLGQVLGLRGYWSLTPLLLLFALVGFAVLKGHTPKP